MRKMRSPETDSSPTMGAQEIPAAVSSITIQGWMQHSERKNGLTVSANDLTSLSALISYVAFHAGENEFSVARRLADRFNIPNVNCLPAAQFDSAIRYLVDHMVGV